ncbi:hypothetical protein [Paraburkholderia sp. RAU6.4a]|uniref:hypothetical protein n=1 Tax=Paraburkholderia sp. RAU6.4a TaxID=2991067 RepID=UPI003D226238
MTASKASIFFRATAYPDGTPCTAAPSSKLFYQYLRGLRAPIPGARGKYGYDLIAEVDRFPGAQRAKVWLDLPLWALIEMRLTPDELRHVLDVTPAGQDASSLDCYVHAWAEFRLAQVRGADREECASLATRIAMFHRKLYNADPVFRYIFDPYMTLLASREPSVVRRGDVSIGLPKSVKVVRIATIPGFGPEARRREKRFWNMVARLIRSGDRPQRSFLAEFEKQWFRLLESALWDDDGAIERMRLGLAPTYISQTWPHLLENVFPKPTSYGVNIGARPMQRGGNEETRENLRLFDKETGSAHRLLQPQNSLSSSRDDFRRYEIEKRRLQMERRPSFFYNHPPKPTDFYNYPPKPRHLVIRDGP